MCIIMTSPLPPATNSHKSPVRILSGGRDDSIEHIWICWESLRADAQRADATKIRAMIYPPLAGNSYPLNYREWESGVEMDAPFWIPYENWPILDDFEIPHFGNPSILSFGPRSCFFGQGVESFHLYTHNESHELHRLTPVLLLAHIFDHFCSWKFNFTSFGHDMPWSIPNPIPYIPYIYIFKLI